MSLGCGQEIMDNDCFDLDAVLTNTEADFWCGCEAEDTNIQFFFGI